VLVVLSLLFGAIMWKNEGCESDFYSVVKRATQEAKELFLLDQNSILQHGFCIPGGRFCNCLCGVSFVGWFFCDEFPTLPQHLVGPVC
jgi:hypothetical protein